jgi:hypothetical protein
MRNVYKITRRPEGKGPLEICRLRREDNIKTDLRETGFADVKGKM